MSAMNAFLSGAAVWVAVRLNLALLNGISARFSKSGESVQEMIAGRFNGGGQ